MKIRKPTEHEFQELRHVIFTSDVSWNPSEFNHQYDAPDISLFENSHYDLFEDDDLVYLDSRHLLDADARNLQRYVAVADFRPLLEQAITDANARSAALGEDIRPTLFRETQTTNRVRALFFKEFERDYPEEFALIQAETLARREEIKRERIEEHARTALNVDTTTDPYFWQQYVDFQYPPLHEINIMEREDQKIRCAPLFQLASITRAIQIAITQAIRSQPGKSLLMATWTGTPTIVISPLK